MSWKDLVSLCIVLIGVGLFLYGSNSYNALVGWSGIYLIIGGIIVEIVLKVYESKWKKGIN